MTDENIFGKKLRELRKGKNLTQRDLAEEVAIRLRAEDRRGFDFTYLSKIENGKTPPPSVAAIRQIAQVLDTDVNELVALAGKVPPEMGETLKEKSAKARTFYRSALDADLTDEDWDKLLQQLKRKTKAREDSSESED